MQSNLNVPFVKGLLVERLIGYFHAIEKYNKASVFYLEKYTKYQIFGTTLSIRVKARSNPTQLYSKKRPCGM